MFLVYLCETYFFNENGMTSIAKPDEDVITKEYYTPAFLMNTQTI